MEKVAIWLDSAADWWDKWGDGVIIWGTILLIAVLVTVIGLGFVKMLEPKPLEIRCAYADNVTQECIDYRVDQCLQTERYSLDQCVELVGK